MLSALEYAGYDVRHDWGDGEHNSRHATRDLSGRPALAVARLAGADQSQPRGKSAQDVYQTLIPGEELAARQRGSSSHRRPGGQRQRRNVLQRPCEQPHLQGGRWTAKSAIFAENTNGVNGMMFGPDGRLYGGATRSRQIVAYDASGASQVHRLRTCSSTTSRSTSKAICTSRIRQRRRSGSCPRAARRAWSTRASSIPTACCFRPTRRCSTSRTTPVSCHGRFRSGPTGLWPTSSAISTSHMPDAATRSSADGMTVDTNGNVYIATALGVQVFDQIGKCHAIIPAPAAGSLSSVKFGGTEPGRALHHARRAGVQAEDQSEGGRVVAGALKPPAPRL